MPASAGTPLARLHDTATQFGITVVDAADDGGPLLDDGTAAFIACGVRIALNPGLDDGLRAEVLAMAPALTYAPGPRHGRPRRRHHRDRRLCPDQPQPRNRARVIARTARDRDRP